MAEKPTITRLHEAPDVEFPWGHLNWLCSGEIDAGAESTFGVCTIKPGERNPRHYHPNCEEVLYVISGQCEHSFGEDTYRLGPGDMIRLPMDVIHNAVNVGEGDLVCVISFSSPERQAVFIDQ